jgi:hypothetical protein
MTEPTSPHLTDDDLVLHYYGEMPGSMEQAATIHLASCPACRGEYTRLQRVLGAIDESTVTPVVSPSFERAVWARLEPNLLRQRSGWTFRLLLSPAPLALAAAVVLLVIGAFLAGREFPASSAPPAGTAATNGADAIRERILLVDVGDHLDRSQMILVELVSGAETGEVDMSAERARAEQLVADNRMYRQAAEQAGDTAISDLLDEIERVLTELAASPDQVSAADLANVRRRVESRDLLFKVRVVASKLRELQRDTVVRQAGQRL